MINSQIYDQILTKCRRAGDAQLRAAIPAELREMLQTWERSPLLPWFLYDGQITTIFCTPNNSFLQLPDGFLNLLEESVVWVSYPPSNIAKTKLKRGYWNDIDEQYVAVTNKIPEAYDIQGNAFIFGPTPDKAYSITFRAYYASAPPPDNGSTVSNPWWLNAEDLVVTGCAARLTKGYIKDAKRGAELDEDTAMLLKNLNNYNESRKHQGFPHEVNN